MQTVRLGRTGAEVSVAGLGCGGASRLGLAYGASVDQAADLVRRALDLGITFIDTAHAYGTEDAVGKGLAGRRDRAFISTKVGPTRSGGLWGIGARSRLLTAREIAQAVEISLRRLRTDRVDLFNLHGVTVDELPHCLEVLVPELKRQQAAGKIRFLGVTEKFVADTRHAMLAKALAGDHPFDVVMTGFSLLNPGARRSVLPLAGAGDVGVLVMFAVRRALSDPATLRETVEGLVQGGEVAAGLLDPASPLGFLGPDGAAVVDAAYRFCRHEPGTHVILTGTGKVEHLKRNIASILAPPLPADDLARLEAAFGRVESLSGN